MSVGKPSIPSFLLSDNKSRCFFLDDTNKLDCYKVVIGVRVPIPDDEKKLLDIFYPYLVSPARDESCLSKNAPEEVKKAFREYMDLISKDCTE